LLSNAVKFTEPGGAVLVIVESIHEGVRISVKDTGLGIPSGDIPHVFDKYYTTVGSMSVAS
jgi:signal transduction histidine kinase